MNFYRYKILNKSLADIAASISVLKETKPPVPVSCIRLEVKPYILSEDIKRSMPAITAHKLQQYTNKIYTIKLQENVTSWLDKLLSIDREECTF